MARGLGQRETNKSTYVGFSKGVFIKRVEEPTEKTITSTVFNIFINFF